MTTLVLPPPKIIVTELRAPFYVTDAEIEELIRYERSFNYVRETQPNCGPEVEIFQRFTGNERGASWCNSFQSFCLYGVWPHIPWRKTGRCQTFREQAHSLGWMLPHGVSPRPGDVGFVIDVSAAAIKEFGRDHAHHVYLVTGEVTGPLLTIPSVEGNTNPAGGSDGYGVFERTARAMKKTTVYEFARLPRKAA